MIYVKIPKDRIGVLIGEKGETKRLLQRRCALKIEVDTETNEVGIHDEVEGADPIMVMQLQDVVKAIGRGFSPERAMKLLNDDNYLELIDIHEFTGKHKEHVRRVSSRIIGSEGKTRRIIEEQSGCFVAVYGHTVALIGPYEGMTDAKQAVEMILRGSEHASVYRFLERKRRDSRRTTQEEW